MDNNLSNLYLGQGLIQPTVAQRAARSIKFDTVVKKLLNLNFL